MSDTHTIEDGLRSLIKDRQIVVVVGSGVSRATNNKSPTWRDLIQSGIQHCRENLGATQRWCDNIAERLDFESDKQMATAVIADALLSAAEDVHKMLRPNGGRELKSWLRSNFETLEPEPGKLQVIKALAALNAPLVTTNYDDLIEKVTKLKHVTWKDPSDVAKFVREADCGVLHLHGIWSEPESVVLGIRSYESVLNDDFIQEVMKALGMTKSFLFVGCGDEGLTDPNFGQFLARLEALETKAGVEHRHYRLICSKEAKPVQPHRWLCPLVYGDDYPELPAFLQQLCPQPVNPTNGSKKKKPRPRQLPELPKSVTAYLTRLAEETSRLKLPGMGRSFLIDLPIADAYVPLQTTLFRQMQEHGLERSQKHHTESAGDVTDLERVFHEAARLGQRGVVLLGEPGSGKTTGARQIAWRLAGGNRSPEDLGLPAGITPVLLRFRNLNRAALADPNGLRRFLADETRSAAAAKGLDEPGEALDQLSAPPGGGLLWILDGLDEVIDPAARAQVSTWVTQAISQRPSDWFLVTCRFAGYNRKGVSLGAQFVEFHVCPLSEKQIGQFVGDWFRAADKLLNHPEMAEAHANKLLNLLNRPDYQTQQLRRLCQYPLMLTILCVVFHEGQQNLPQDRFELYELCVLVLLKHLRQQVYELELTRNERNVLPVDPIAAKTVLARMAWWMHGEQQREAASMEELAAEAKRGLAQVSLGCGLGDDGRAFIERMKDETGILAGDNQGRYGFLHLTFQEYLAADHAVREGLAQDLASRATDSWWEEVTLLSLSRTGPFFEVFFRELLANGIAETRPDVAEHFLAEAKGFSAAPFLEVLSPNNSAPPRRVVAVLRLLRERATKIPGLAEIVSPFATSVDPETQGFAREILGRLGITLPPVTNERNVFVDERTGITFVSIPDGEFDMGSNEYDDERRVHRVRLSHDFWLAKYPVTNAQYGEYMKSAGPKVEPPAYWDNRRFNQPEQPVVGVSWHDAQAFCEWAGCRLPTEAEWEYACRAGEPGKYSFGNDESQLGEYAWFADNSGSQTQPVGTKRPNAWGLYDMHGNVWEWCEDIYDAELYARRQGVTTDPLQTSGSDYRVLRGGSWGSNPRDTRSAYRDRLTPGDRYSFTGFRAVCVSRPRT
ncbi:MAG: SUMF1/EgtB/PvdO family nonheme iron enzyme [Planctomycetaceae bacterium]